VALTNKEQLEATFSQNTHFDTFTADIQLADGKVTLNPLHAKLTGIALTGMGDFDLLDQEFEATFKARLSPELEQVDHACRVSKRLTAIEWPINCNGRIDTEPGKWCKVDARSILHDLTINEGREKLEKKAGKLFNKWFNKGD
jgi:AsmA protein